MSDRQWRAFRSALPMALILLSAHTLSSRSLLWFLQKKGASLDEQIRGRAAIALAGVFLLHGLNTLKILLLLAINYWIGKNFAGSRLNPLLSWMFAIGLLLALEYLSLSQYLEGSILGRLGKLFELLPGAYSRWDITFNVTLLRMLSFNMDYYYSYVGDYAPLQVSYAHFDFTRDTLEAS